MTYTAFGQDLMISARLCETLQQVRNRAAARVRREAHHADGAGAYVDAVRLRENGIARDNVERSGDITVAENEKPGPDVTRALSRRQSQRCSCILELCRQLSVLKMIVGSSS
jgi:hypothetical protein